MTFLNSKLGPETIQLIACYNTHLKQAWSICELQDLPKNVSRIVQIVHSESTMNCHYVQHFGSLILFLSYLGTLYLKSRLIRNIKVITNMSNSFICYHGEICLFIRQRFREDIDFVRSNRILSNPGWIMHTCNCLCTLQLFLFRFNDENLDFS